MGREIKVLSDVELGGQLSYSYNLTSFPENPSLRTIIVKDGMPYIYTELVSGSGYNSWVPMGVRYANYVHTQGVASSTWTVTHNFNTADFIYFVYDSAHNLVTANNTIVDSNTVQINLTTAITGTVVMFSADQTSAPIVNMNGGSGDENITGDLTISGNIMPAVNGVSTIGSPTEKFAAIYTKEMFIDANTLYVDGVAVLGSSANSITVTADVNQGLRLATTGTGQLVLDSQAATTVKTSGVNADVLIQSEGTGSTSRITSSTQNTLTAPVTAIVGNATVSNNLTVTGNLNISGSTTIIDAANLTIKDNIVTVNKGETGSGVTLRYAGVEVDRGDLARQRLVWDETAGKWKAGETNSEVALATEAYVTTALAGSGSSFSGSYADLTNKPTLFSGAYADLTGAPSLATVATSGSYDDLTNKPTLFSGSYADLTNKPTTLSGYGITDATVLPTQTGNTGYYLTTNGTTLSWAAVAAGDALPTQTGNAGYYLTTDGTTASWAAVAGGGGGGLTTTDDATTNASYYPILATTAGGSEAKTSSTKLYFNPSTGVLNATTFNSLSDRNFKTDIAPLQGALGTVNALEGVSFNWKETGVGTYGVIAQDIEQVLPNIVQTNEKGEKSVEYQAIIPFLIEAVKELTARVAELENK